MFAAFPVKIEKKKGRLESRPVFEAAFKAA
jgi:hypothetical protein